MDTLRDAWLRYQAERMPPEKPKNYKVICVSFYLDDIELADRLVADLKRRGCTNANRSMLLRILLRAADPEALAKHINLK